MSDDGLDVGSAVCSQADEVMSQACSEGEGLDQPATQMAFATQMPVMQHCRASVDKISAATCGELSNRAIEGISAKTIPSRTRKENLLALIGKPKVDGPVTNNVNFVKKAPKEPQKVTGNYSNGCPAQSLLISNISNLGDTTMHDAESASQGNFRETEQKKSSELTTAVDTAFEEKHLRFELTHARRPRLSDSSQQSLCTDEEASRVTANEASAGSVEIVRTSKTDGSSPTGAPRGFSGGPPTRDLDRDPWKGMTRLSRQAVGISAEQQALLSRQDCWIPPESGGIGPVANVPIGILKALNTTAEQREQETGLSQPESTPQEPRASPESGTASPVSICESNSSGTPLPWSSSPNMPPDSPKLPPDSPTQQARHGLPGAGNECQDLESSALAVHMSSTSSVRGIEKPQETIYRQSSSACNADEVNHQTDFMQVRVERHANDDDLAVGISAPCVRAASSTDPSKSNRAIQVMRTPIQSGESQKDHGIDGDAERSGGYMDIDLSSDPVIPGTLDRSPIDPQQRASRLGGDGCADYNEKRDKAMVDLQIRTDIDAFSQRSISESPLKAEILALADGYSEQREPRDHPEISSSTSSVLTGTPSRESREVPVDNKRRASEMSPNFAKRRRKCNAPSSFNFSQEDQNSQDPARIGQKARGEFMRSLSVSKTRASSSYPVASYDGTNVAHAQDNTVPSKSDMPHVRGDVPPSLSSADALTNNQGEMTSTDQRAITLSTPGVIVVDQSDSHPTIAIASQHSDVSGLLDQEAPQQMKSISFTPLNMKLNQFDRNPDERKLLQRFRDAYPDYSGEPSHFNTMCSRIIKLAAENRMEHKFLWDDFVGRHKGDYKDYCNRCMEDGKDPIPYELFYHEHVDAPKYTKGILSPANLKGLQHSHEEAVRRLNRRPASSSPQVHNSASLSTLENGKISHKTDSRRDSTRIFDDKVVQTSRAQSSFEGSRADTPAANTNIPPRNLPWIESKQPSQKIWHSMSEMATSYSSPEQVRACDVHKAMEMPQKEGIHLGHYSSPSSSKPLIKLPRSAPVKETSGLAVRAGPLAEAVRPNAPRDSSTPVASDVPEAAPLPGKWDPSPSRSRPNVSHSALLSLVTRLDETESEKFQAGADRTEHQTRNWWKDRNTPFKEFARAYVALKSVNGAMGIVDKEGFVEANLKGIDVLRWDI